jgi:hypothetical protein
MKKLNLKAKAKESSEEDSSGSEYSVSPKNEFAEIEHKESRY